VVEQISRECFLTVALVTKQNARKLSWLLTKLGLRVDALPRAETSWSTVQVGPAAPHSFLLFVPRVVKLMLVTDITSPLVISARYDLITALLIRHV